MKVNEMTNFYYVIEKTVKPGEVIKELGEGEETWRSRAFREHRMATFLYKKKARENTNALVYYHVRMEDSEADMKDKSHKTEVMK